MRTATTASPTQREPELVGQTVVVIGGSAGIWQWIMRTVVSPPQRWD